MDIEQSDVKLRILLAARKLFARQGFDRTTVRQICEEAGVNLALVSYHFGGKEKVFYALFETFFPSNLLAEYEEILRQPVAGIQVIIREVIRFRMESPEMAKMIQQEVVMGSPRVERIFPYLMPVWSSLRRLLEQGRQEGIFQFRSLDYTLLLIMGNLIFPNSNPVQNRLVSGELPDLDELVEDTIQYVFRGLGYE